jgi:hypothetical protein
MSQPIPVDMLKQTITYFYLLAYCPPEKVAEFKQSTASMLKGLAGQAGLKEKAFLAQALPEACLHIVAFHQATREPDRELVDALVKAARTADKNSETLAAFKELMARIAALPGRAKLENRLHRKKGCAFCQWPCYYGYFSLVSEPEFNGLQRMLEAEAQQPKLEQNPIRPVLEFTLSHLAQTTQVGQGVIQRVHLGNLAYCLLMLSMAKSRLALPESELRVFQTSSQAWIQAGS